VALDFSSHCTIDTGPSLAIMRVEVRRAAGGVAGGLYLAKVSSAKSHARHLKDVSANSMLCLQMVHGKRSLSGSMGCLDGPNPIL